MARWRTTPGWSWQWPARQPRTGADILTHVDVTHVGDGQATLRDEDGEFTITAEHIITCWSWTEELNPDIRLSRCIYLVVEV